MMSKFISMSMIFLSMSLMSNFWIFMSQKQSLMAEWKILNVGSMKISFDILLDEKSLIFTSFVMMITSMIIFYMHFYISMMQISNFTKLVAMFSASMLLLIISPSMVSLIVSWEGLGMTSFLLIMYYQNKKSLMSSFYTMILNRVGDTALIMSIIMMMKINSWNFLSTMTYSSKNLMLILLITGAFCKSAQLPFSSWLTEAMAAPAPISALVHSSTLVTAGVYLIIRFEPVMSNSLMKSTILAISVSTLFMASMNSLTEWNIKKLVALSTLMQLSVMLFSVSMNKFNLAMYHILMHATFKSLIFLCMNSFIHAAMSYDLRKMGKLTNHLNITNFSFSTATMALCGFPFMSGFFSKDLIMETLIIKTSSYVLVIFFYASMMCTTLYSMKMLIYSNFNLSKMTTKSLTQKMPQPTSKMVILMMSTFMGNKLNWTLNLEANIMQLNLFEKLTPLFMILWSVIFIKSKVYYISVNKNLSNNFIMSMMNFMWSTKSISVMIKTQVLTFYYSVNKTTEQDNFIYFPATLSNMFKTISLMNFSISHKKFFNLTLILFIMMILYF